MPMFQSSTGCEAISDEYHPSEQNRLGNVELWGAAWCESSLLSNWFLFLLWRKEFTFVYWYV